MLYDRTYMRKPFAVNPRCIVDVLIIFLISCFAIQSILNLFSEDLFSYYRDFLLFSFSSIPNFLIWTPLTYAFFHDGPFHLIINLLGFYFIGKSVEIDVGKVNFCYLIFFGAIVGSLFWLSFNNSGQYLIGSSASVMSCLAFYCLKRPDNQITLLLFFILPCKLKPRWLLLGVLTIELYGFIFDEINSNTSTAHSAPLGGLTAGALVFLFLRSGREFPYFILRSTNSKISSTNFKSIFSNSEKTIDTNSYKVNFSNTGELQTEVDRILDKINESGFGALTREEKLTLDKAKGLLRD